MMFEPTLILSRLLVAKGGVAVYDEVFHHGLNIIRGENGSGKTTVADFIFFALGGDTPLWREEASRCDYVYAEVHINGIAVTFRRQIEQGKFRPMAIYWGGFEKALGAQTEWQLFPYSGTTAKESFSQVIFRAAGIPEVKGEASKVTMHQVLRLLYVDQKTAYDQLFRTDPFDKQLTREAVGDLLCGVYDEELYTAESQLAEKQSAKSALHSELRTILSLLGDQAAPSIEWLQGEKNSRFREREQAYTSLDNLRTRSPQAGETIGNRRNKVAADLEKQNQLVLSLQSRLRQARIDIADRDQFLQALKERLTALRESQTIHDSLGALSFQFCPACYAPLTPQANACHLCKNASENHGEQNLLLLRHELEQQISESEAMQSQLTNAADVISKDLRPAEDAQRRLQLQYEELSTAPHASLDVAAADLYRKIGYLDRTIEDLEQRSRFAERISVITELQARLAADISRLNDEIALRTARQEDTKQHASRLISDLTVQLLKRDLPRESAFSGAAQVEFDFGLNRISVDGRSNFAASSNVFLKNAFHAAFLQASLRESYFRYPRLIVFDNVEDKGMEPPRSHNFQRLVRELSDATEVEHQIILFTSMIAPEFEEETAILVGPLYTHDTKTLRFSSLPQSTPE